MKSEAVSKLLTRIMLCILLVMLVYALLSCLPVAKTYAVSFAGAAAVVLLYIVISRRRGRPAVKLGAGKVCALITLLFFAVNLPGILIFRIEPSNDFTTFWGSACGLAESGMVYHKWYVACFPHILGYSTFLGLFIRIFGQSLMMASLINLILTAISGLIIFRLCLNWLDLDAAAFAYMLWALCPSKLLYNSMVLSEPLYTTLLLLFVLIVSALYRRRYDLKWWVFVGAGAVAGTVLWAVNVTRPVAAVALIAFFIWMALLRGGDMRRKKQWGLWLCFSAAMLLLYIPLGSLWENYIVSATGEKPADTPYYSIYVGLNPQTNGEYSYDDAQVLNSAYYQAGSAEGAQALMGEALEERINSGEINIPKLVVKKLSTFLGFDEGGAYYMKAILSDTEYTVLSLASNVYYYALMLLAILGGLRLFRRGDTDCVQIAPMYILGLTMAHMLVEVAPRYHYSVLPMLIIMAAFSRESGLLKGKMAYLDSGTEKKAL